MKLGLIADIHADAPTLARTLDQLDALGAEHILCAGDLVDYGCCPEQAVSLVRARGIPCVRGNHDHLVFRRDPAKLKPHHTDPARLSPDNLDYLRALPFDFLAQYDGLRVAIYHAGPGNDLALVHPEYWSAEAMESLLKEAGADVLVLGHTHVPIHIETRAGVLINPGSLLCRHETRLPSSRTFGLLDTETMAYQLFDAESGLAYALTSWPWKIREWRRLRPGRGAPPRG